jgi:hypothetical protein
MGLIPASTLVDYVKDVPETTLGKDKREMDFMIASRGPLNSVREPSVVTGLYATKN